MVKKCVICFKNYYCESGSRSLHMFPRNISMRTKWLEWLVSVGYGVLTPSTNDCICSDHFKPEDFYEAPSGKKVLRKTSVPSEINFMFESRDTVAQTLSSRSTSTFEPHEGLCAFETAPKNPVNIDVDDSNRSIELQNISFTALSPRKSGSYTSTTETAQESESVTSSPQIKKRKIRYLGDVHTSDFDSPRTAKECWNIVKSTVLTHKRKIHNLQQNRRRLQKRISSLKSFISYLKKNFTISEGAETSIQASLSGDSDKIIKQFLRGKSCKKYDSTLRSFALTLNFYSPKAYNFVREKFNKSLPHPSTITKWYQTVDGSPGFTKEALSAIQLKSAEIKEKGGKVLCNLVIDEMAIRKRVEWDGKMYRGYINIGTKLDSDNLPEAKEVLVLMLVAINSHWKIPVGYFLIDGLSGAEKANLLKQCLEFVHQTGIIVTSLTFDGAPSNFSMAKYLGANLTDMDNLSPFFLHPVTKQKVFIFPDPCHMIKLIRNCLGTFKTLMSNGKIINWNYLESLINFQDTEGLHAGTKINKRHINWTQEKMKVKIAAQTFSRSVSEALNCLCSDLHLEIFKGAEETAHFVKLFNDFFDILNSRSRFSKYIFKRPLSSATKNLFFNFLDSAKAYICSLKLENGTSVLQSSRKTGFLGFLICGESLKLLYDTYVENESPLLKYIIGYKFSQDHLEIFFSAIRSRGGYNNNPTAKQFESTYKRLLIHAEIKGSDYANAITLDNTSILYCTSRNTIVSNEIECDIDLPNLSLDDDDHNYACNSEWHLTDFVSDVVAYISGFIVKSLKKHITCVKCLQILETDKTVSKLQIQKCYGNLVNSSEFVIEICQTGEKYFRWLQKTINITNNKYKNLIDKLILQTVSNLPPTIYNVFGDHLFDDLLENHGFQLN